VDQAAGNFQLQASSPCINAGTNGYVVPGFDLAGNTRIVSGTVDLGAYENQAPTLAALFGWFQTNGISTHASSLRADPDQDGMNNLQEWLAGTDPDDRADLPADWESQVDNFQRPTRDTLFEVIYTSGTTGVPKGVMLLHGTVLATLEAIAKILPPREHRAVSLLPPSHLFEQAPVRMFGTMIGAHITFVRSRNPRVIFDSLREARVTTMVLVPQLLELFWLGLEREVKRQGKDKTFERARRVARLLPYWARRLIFRSVHRQLGGALNLMVSAGAYLPPALQQAWEDLGVVVVQGYGATECGPAAATSEQDHPKGTVGKTPAPVTLRLAEGTGEIEIGGPTVFDGYWKDPDATAAAKTTDGWYRTGDVGRFDSRGNLVLQGRTAKETFAIVLTRTKSGDYRATQLAR
jgi:long-chain acyl-CoA synthetase